MRTRPLILSKVQNKGIWDYYRTPPSKTQLPSSFPRPDPSGLNLPPPPITRELPSQGRDVEADAEGAELPGEKIYNVEGEQ